MEGLKVANRYAQALFELAEENKVTDGVLTDMKFFLATTNDNKDFHNFINSPLIKADKKNEVFDKLFNDFQKLSLKFIHLLTKNSREMILPLIADEYVTKINVARGIIPVTLTTASRLDDDIKTKILDKLTRQIDGKIELTEKEDASLIGGFIVRMGDTRIDASISNQLYKMKNRLGK